MTNTTLSAALETTTGFTLDVDLLNSAQLGYLQTPLDALIRSASWKRGRDTMLDSFSAGSCQIVFDNRNNLFTPSNGSSPLYGELYPGRAMTLTADGLYGPIQVFSGFVEKWDYGFTLDGDSIVTLNALDALSWLASKNISSLVCPAESTGDRIVRVLEAVQFPPEKRSIQKGYSVLKAETLTNANALEYLQKVVLSEFGLFFADGSGVLVFKQRNQPNVYQTFQVTNSTPDPYISDVSFDYSFDQVFNSVVLDNGVTTATGSNSASMTLYGERATKFDVLLNTQTQMDAMAQGLASLYATPQMSVKEAKVNIFARPMNWSQGDQQANMYATEIGLYTSVAWYPPGSETSPGVYSFGIIQDPAQVVGVSHSASPAGWVMTVKLDKAVGVNALILDDAQQGILDSFGLGL